MRFENSSFVFVESLWTFAELAVLLFGVRSSTLSTVWTKKYLFKYVSRRYDKISIHFLHFDSDWWCFGRWFMWLRCLGCLRLLSTSLDGDDECGEVGCDLIGRDLKIFVKSKTIKWKNFGRIWMILKIIIPFLSRSTWSHNCRSRSSISLSSLCRFICSASSFKMQKYYFWVKRFRFCTDFWVISFWTYRSLFNTTRKNGKTSSNTFHCYDFVHDLLLSIVVNAIKLFRATRLSAPFDNFN